MLRVRTIVLNASVGPAYSNLFFSGTGSSDAASAHAAVVDAWTVWRTVMANYAAIGIDGEVVEIEPETGEVTATYSIDTVNLTGASAGDQLPTQTQGLLRFR